MSALIDKDVAWSMDTSLLTSCGFNAYILSGTRWQLPPTGPTFLRDRCNGVIRAGAYSHAIAPNYQGGQTHTRALG